MGVEVALAVTAAAATATAAVSYVNYEAGKDAASAQRALVDQQKAALKSQQDAAAADAARMAGTGATFGRGDDSQPRGLSTGFGFGSAPSGSANSGRAQITGMM